MFISPLRGKLQQQKKVDLQKDGMSEELPIQTVTLTYLSHFLWRMVGKKPKDMVLYIFVCQAGDVRMIRSDNGSNLVGASTELTCELQEMNHIKKKNSEKQPCFCN